MTRLLSTVTVAAVLLSMAMIDPARSRGSVAVHGPWAPEHVEALPPDIRWDAEQHAKACGNRPAAQHYFSVSIAASGLRFHAQHFEEFACERRSLLCRPEGCLHEVFVDDGRRQRQVFNVYARDIKLTNDGGVAGIQVFAGAGVRSFIWNGRRFVASGNARRER